MAANDDLDLVQAPEAPAAEAPLMDEAPEAPLIADAPEVPEAPEVPAAADEAPAAEAAAHKAKPKKGVIPPRRRVEELDADGKKPMRWYVVQAFSGFEQRVAQTLRERVRIHGMEDDFGEILVPKEKVKEIKDGKKRESERKFFPGYVLVHMRMTDETWQLVKHTDRVLGFIGGTPDRPLPITKAEAERILSRLKESEESPRPKTIFEVGESVRAIDGAFKDFVGTVEKVDYEKNRLTVSIAIFGRATPVDLEFSQVEKDI